MRRGTPVELLYRAHRAGEGGLLSLDGPLGSARLWLRKGKVQYSEGIDLDRLAAVLPAGSQLNGDIFHDVSTAIASGMKVEEALELASADIGFYLGRVVQAGATTATFEAGVEAPQGAFPLPGGALQMLASGLRRARHPDAVAGALKGEWNTPIRVSVPGPSWLAGLDPICLRTLRMARESETLGDVILQSGRGQVERTRHAWRAVDLLLQLRLLEFGDGGDWAEDATGPLPEVSQDWVPTHPPEEVSGPVPPPDKLLGAESVDDDTPDAVIEEDWDDFDTEPTDAPPAGPSLEAEMARLGALCVEINPLIIVQISPRDLHGPLTRDAIDLAYRASAARFSAEAFLTATDAARASARSFRSLLKENHDALKNQAIVAAWLRDLRAFERNNVRVELDDEVDAERLFAEGRAAAASRDWAGALVKLEEALDRNPLASRYRVLHIFLLVATRKLTPSDGVMNLDALDLEDPRAMAQAQVTAGRLLKAARRETEALSRFRTALQLDPTRSDAKAEVLALSQ